MPTTARSLESEMSKDGLEILFLGSGNAFAAQGRAHSSFLLNGRFLFDAGPTTVQQFRRAGVDTSSVEAIFISHFHADHFFGLPFLLLDFWRAGRTKDLYIVGPPGIEARTESLTDLGFPGLPPGATYKRRYVEVQDGEENQLPGLEFSAVEVEHVPTLQCFGFLARAGDKSLMYSGDARMCSGLVSLASAADILVLDCSCAGDVVHLSQQDVQEVRRYAPASARTILSHLDRDPDSLAEDKIFVASDLQRFRF
jgi:ribonuclease Z